MFKAKRILKKLDYLPRWVWYALSLCVGGPIGPVVVYVVFHALTKAAQDETDDERTINWDVDIDSNGVHVRSRRGASSTAYRDAECTVTGDDDVDAQWQRTESNARQAQRAARSAPKTEAPQQTAAAAGDDCEAVILEGRDALRRIRHANDLIADPALSAQIDSIEDSCRQILSILEQRPQLLPQLRTFLRYYLPTTLKLLDARARLENTASTPKALEVRTRISDALGVIDKAFKKQVEALDEYRFIDLESEMDVLRDMLRADGLVDDPVEAEDDPFADVLKARADSKNARPDSEQRNIPLAGH